VLQDGKIVKAKGYGFANLETSAPATPDTVYKIGSVSKCFIAAGIMLLVEDAKLGLDDPIGRYLDGVPDAWRAITIRHLLTHTSGIVEDPPGFTPFRAQPDADVVRSLYTVPLLFAPGEKWSYSNAAYFALGEIIHKVSGRPWAEFLDERIFRPLHMDATRTTTTTEIVPNRASGHIWSFGRFQKTEDWVAVRPSGAFLSTVLDLARWDGALQSRSILKPETWQQILSPVGLNSGKTHPYGFGFFLDPFQDHRRIYHDGQLPGFLTVFESFPADHLTVITMSDTDDVALGKLTHSIAGFYVPQLAPPAYQTIADTEPEVTATVKRLIAGLVKDDPDMTLFTAGLRSDLTAPVRAYLTRVLGKFGAVQGISLVERTPVGQGATYRYRVLYRDGSLFLICSMDGTGKIQGIWQDADTSVN